jgi:cyclopropane fatty-acyl-phospholipid synthase-like methyltransferase
LPIPPLEMRELVGRTDPTEFDNPTRALVYGGLPAEQFRSVLDFGCGCGRVARQLIQQSPRPQRYEGLDLHAGMIRWAAENLTPSAPQFHFAHHDVYYPSFNPGDGKPRHSLFPFGGAEFSLIVAISVFTHLTQDQAKVYMAEMARVLESDGVIICTWFLFQKRDFPMMQEEQNTLFINEYDVRNAVIYDRDWVRSAASDVGLTLCEAHPPSIRGFQWELRFRPSDLGAVDADWPVDEAPDGRHAPPAMRADAHRIGEID